MYLKKSINRKAYKRVITMIQAMGANSLEAEVQKHFDTYHTPLVIIDFIASQLNPLKAKDDATYQHSLRVGLLGAKAGSYLGTDEKILFYAGLLHDVGKLDIADEILKKTDEFTLQDREIMKSHSMNGYNRTHERMPVTAATMVGHHHNGNDPYPVVLPPLTDPVIVRLQETIGYCSLIVPILDWYDAATTRANSKNGGKPLSREDAVMCLREKFQENIPQIEKMYVANIL
jgi:putative nucleotidyltransferase with HDIG domain